MTQANGTNPGDRTLIAAHRAGAGLWPENSLTAFRNSLMMEVDFIEFDVHRSRDGMLVVHHDAILGRTAEGVGAIGETSWADLRRLPLRGAPHERIPLLSAVLETFGASPVRPRLELKADARDRLYPGMTAEVLSALRAQGLIAPTVITSFDPDYLDEARREGAVDMIWLLDDEAGAALMADIGGFARGALSRGIAEVAVRGADATPDLVRACRDNGLILGAYAGKDLDFDRLFDIGLSVFTTDRPDLAIKAKSESQRIVLRNSP